MNISRFKITIAIFLLIAALWIVQLFAIQIIDVYNFKSSRYNRNNPSKRFLNPIRGKILDRNGKVLVATNLYFQLDFDKNAIKNYLRRKNDPRTVDEVLDQIATICSEVTNKKKSSFEKKLAKKTPVLFFHLLEEDKLKLVRKFKQNKITGYVIQFSKYKRTYLSDNTALRLIGNIKENIDTVSESPLKNSKYTLQGISGIESSYNDHLAGSFGWKEYLNNAKGEPLPVKDLQFKDVVNGSDVQLTIDIELQRSIEAIIQEGVEKYEAQTGMCTVMDPKTGEILAMVGVTNNDVNLDSKVLRSYGNLPVSYKFEPGSTFKPFTMLSALEKVNYDPLSTIDCSDYYPNYTGQKKGKERKITDDHKSHGPQNGEEIIAHSSNVGIAKIAEKMGADVYYSFLRNLGFGQTARTNFYGIKKGTLRPTYKWSQFSLHSISYGQEIGVTQLQLANAYCAIANGGTLMKPIIIKRITDPNGKLVEEEAPTPIRKIASKKSIKTMQGFLGKVFEYGTAKRYNNSTIGLAGKTGTAEVKSLKTRGSDKWEYTSSFVGYLPIDDPKYVIVVTYDKPKRKFRYAASSALPSFEKVYQTILDLPDNNLKITYEIRQKNFISMPSLIDMTIEDAKDLLQAKNINYHCETSDNKRIVKTQFPKAGTSFSPDERPVSFSSDKFDTENNDELIPNYIGMSLREAMKLSLSKNIKTNIKGSGVIYKQSLKAGLTIDSEKLLILEARAN